MAYTVPTASQLKTLYPAFAAVPDATVNLYIARAGSSVDTSWLERDYADALMLLAAHYMVLSGLGTGAEAQVNAAGMSGFSSIRSGQLSLQRSATSQSADYGEYGGSQYGIQFYWLLKKNKPAVAVSGGTQVNFEVPYLGYPMGEW